MVDLEELIEDAKLRKQGIEMESISLENIYEILRTFEEIYDIMDDKEQKTLITYLIRDNETFLASDIQYQGNNPYVWDYLRVCRKNKTINRIIKVLLNEGKND